MHFTHFLIYSWPCTFEEGTIAIPIFQTRTLRLRDMKQFTKYQSEPMPEGSLSPESLPSITTRCCSSWPSRMPLSPLPVLIVPALNVPLSWLLFLHAAGLHSSLRWTRCLLLLPELLIWQLLYFSLVLFVIMLSYCILEGKRVCIKVAVQCFIENCGGRFLLCFSFSNFLEWLFGYEGPLEQRL